MLTPFLIWGIYNSWHINMDYITPPAHLTLLPQPPNPSKSSYRLSSVGGILLQEYPERGWLFTLGSRAQTRAIGLAAWHLAVHWATGILPSKEERYQSSQHRAQARLSWASFPWHGLAGRRVVTLHSGVPHHKYQINILRTWRDAIWVFKKKKSAGVSVGPFHFALSEAERDPDE